MYDDYPKADEPDGILEEVTYDVYSVVCTQDEMYIDPDGGGGSGIGDIRKNSNDDDSPYFYHDNEGDDYDRIRGYGSVGTVVITRQQNLPAPGSIVVNIGGSCGGGIGGGVGGSASNGDPGESNIQEDPCARAKRLAQELSNALNDPKVKAQLDQFIKDYKNASKEYGFNIVRTPNGYDVSEIAAGDHNSVSLDIGDDVIATVHNHPLGGSSVHSSTDIYHLNNYIDNPSYLGSIVVRGDDMHVLSITNTEQYTKFYQQKDKYYDKDAKFGWKKDTKIEKDFESFSNDYMQLYKEVDATYPTQLYLMNKYKMGVSLQKWDGTNFNSLKTNAKYKSGTGSSTTIGSGGQTINSRYESITIEVNCK